MTITNAEIAARLADRFAMTANDELVRLYPDEAGGFVDGNFDSWQVGTSFSISGQTKTYTADMWYCDAGFSGVATVSQDTRTLGGEPSGMTRPSKYRLKFQQTTSASIESRIGQALESVAQYNGQSITVSYWLQSDVNMNVVNVNLIQNFGTGGSPSSTVTTTKAVTWAVTTTEKRFSVRLDVPSISGKTLGTNGNDYLAVELRTQTGLTFTLYVDQAQIDVCGSAASSDTTGAGGTPQPFRYRGPALEMMRVLRSLWVFNIPAFGAFNTCAIQTTTRGYSTIQYPVTMRKAPAIALTSGALQITAAGSAFTVTAFSSANVGPLNGIILTDVASGLTVGQAGYIQSGSGGAVLTFDARL
ncbi:hypothetical protein ABXK61_15970 [Burkholderia sola]|uniref:hypothetical protein n=1 Tax=Burkholderia TaxID=32008 RepID=UPI001AE58415|nr:hypothetical protein [Burkholderia sp. AcTa6-5]MBP0714804.1 hypothetical protein [Burkholderia sp. AcTa6-5]